MGRELPDTRAHVTEDKRTASQRRLAQKAERPWILAPQLAWKRSLIRCQDETEARNASY